MTDPNVPQPPRPTSADGSIIPPAPLGSPGTAGPSATQPYAASSPSASQPYPAPPVSGYAPWTPAPPRGLSIAGMVIGIVSIVFSWLAFFLPGVSSAVPLVGLVLGIVGLKKEPAGRGYALAGIWMNSIVLGLTVLLILGVLALIALGLFAIPLFGSSEDLPANA